MSKTRKIYFLRLAGRVLAFAAGLLILLFRPEEFSVLEGMNFFGGFSWLHIMWLIWITDMIIQLLPVRAYISIGSQKQFLARFRPMMEKFNYRNLKKHIVMTTKSAYKVFLIWTAVTVVIGILHRCGVIGSDIVFMICMFFYVADLICVLIWCPFRLIMKNRCCTTCRIFNWDHLMMFSPFFFVGGFYAQSLLLPAIAVWLVWELCVMMYPERFWEATNMALRCSECTDKLCTQYCRKLREKNEKNA